MCPENKSDLPKAGTTDINKIIQSLNVNKAKGSDGISAKFVKMSAGVIACHLANIINDIAFNKYLKQTIKATVRPIFKKR